MDKARTRWVLSQAQDEVAQARLDVAACQGLPWVSPAATAYEDQASAVAADLARCARDVDRCAALVAADVRGGPHWCTADGGPTPAVHGQVTPLSRSAIGGTAVHVGAHGATVVDPEVLQEAAARLDSAGDRLGHVQGLLGPLMVVYPEPLLTAPDERHVLEQLLAASWAPRWLSERLGTLADRLRRTAAVEAAGESSAASFVRGAAAVWGELVGRLPAPVLAADGLVWAGIGGVVGLAVVGRAANAIGVQNTGTLLEAAGVAAGKAAVRSGAVEVATTAVSGLARSQLTGGAPTLHPVPDGAGALAALITGPAGRPVLTPVAAPVQQPAPRGLGDVMGVVARTYDDSTPTGLPGTDVATVTVQRLDRPDGTRAWLVAVPGTRTMSMSGAVPTDMGTNLRLEAGTADTMTAGVVAAMHRAGIGAGEPVVLAGHSQGGMVAMHVAAVAAGSFTVGAVVTAGSPDIPAALPAGVPVVRMEHVEDGTARLDGAPTRVTPQVTAITRELAADGHGTPDWGAAHEVSGYVETAQRVDRALADAPGSIPGVAALDGVLGGAGTTATTSQYVIRREVG